MKRVLNMVSDFLRVFSLVGVWMGMPILLVGFLVAVAVAVSFNAVAP